MLCKLIDVFNHEAYLLLLQLCYMNLFMMGIVMVDGMDRILFKKLFLTVEMNVQNDQILDFLHSVQVVPARAISQRTAARTIIYMTITMHIVLYTKVIPYIINVIP